MSAFDDFVSHISSSWMAGWLIFWNNVDLESWNKWKTQKKLIFEKYW
jgi:hypothetical protein